MKLYFKRGVVSGFIIAILSQKRLVKQKMDFGTIQYLYTGDLIVPVFTVIILFLFYSNPAVEIGLFHRDNDVCYYVNDNGGKETTFTFSLPSQPQL